MRYRMTAVDRKFNRKVHEAAMKDGRYVIPIEGMKFCLKEIGIGAFARVHLGRDEDGNYLALKVFKNERDLKSKSATAIEYRKACLREREEIFKEDPFAKLRCVFNSGNNYGFVGEYFDGIDVARGFYRSPPVIDDKVIDFTDRELQAKLFGAYVGLLKSLHAKGMLVFDNSWRNVMVNHDEVRVIDPDSVRSFEELETLRFDWLKRGYSPLYASFAQVSGEGYSESVDLEGVALMIDRFFCGDDGFFKKYREDDVEDILQRVRQEKRNYPVRRVRKIPHRLREYVVQVISKPTKHGMTLSDLESAVNHTFNL